VVQRALRHHDIHCNMPASSMVTGSDVASLKGAKYETSMQPPSPPLSQTLRRASLAVLAVRNCKLQQNLQQNPLQKKRGAMQTATFAHLSAIVSDSLDTLCIMLAMQMRPDSSWSATCTGGKRHHQSRHKWDECALATRHLTSCQCDECIGPPLQEAESG
jgi:hypothetical protein